MPTATEMRQPGPLVPPDEKFWQRYTPRHELPVGGMTSVFLHGVVVGVLLLAGFLTQLRWHSDANKPPRMDVVMLEGAGEGFEGIGAEPGLPGEKGDPIENIKNSSDKFDIDNSDTKLSDAPKLELSIPVLELGPPEKNKDLLAELVKIGQEADEAVKKEMKIAPPVKMPGVGTKAGGTDNPKGKGGQGGSGDGPGKGTKGKGLGSGGVGKPATRQEILAWRWRFDLTGGGKEHAEKLTAIGVTLAIPEPRGNFLVVQDLSQRPVQTKIDNLAKYKDAVKWYNTKPESISALADELRLPFAPKYVVLLLPKEREDKMAEEEARYAKRQGRNLNRVTATWFDFRPRDGVFEPVVIRQE